MPFRMAETESVAVVKVIGLGGGGGNAINTMVDNKLQGVDFIVANTDKQAPPNPSFHRLIGIFRYWFV